MKFGFIFLATLIITAPALAEELAPPPGPQGQLVGDSHDGAHAIGLLLRCPVCQGMPISDSPADMAQSMMSKVRSMHKEGKSENEILKYFTDRYGDWVLLRPKAGGFNWLVWVLPPFVLFLGILVALMRGRASQGGRQPAQPASDSDEDEYLKAIRTEVEL